MRAVLLAGRGGVQPKGGVEDAAGDDDEQPRHDDEHDEGQPHGLPAPGAPGFSCAATFVFFTFSHIFMGMVSQMLNELLTDRAATFCALWHNTRC